MCRRLFPLIVLSLTHTHTLSFFLSLSLSHPSLFSLPRSIPLTLFLFLSSLLATAFLARARHHAAHTAPRQISNAESRRRRRRLQHVRRISSDGRVPTNLTLPPPHTLTRRPHHSPLREPALLLCPLFDHHCRAAAPRTPSCLPAARRDRVTTFVSVRGAPPLPPLSHTSTTREILTERDSPFRPIYRRRRCPLPRSTSHPPCAQSFAVATRIRRFARCLLSLLLSPLIKLSLVAVLVAASRPPLIGRVTNEGNCRVGARR